MCGRIEGAGSSTFGVIANILDRLAACGASWNRHGSIRLCRQPWITVRHTVARTRQLTGNRGYSFREEDRIRLEILCLCRKGLCALSFVYF